MTGSSPTPRALLALGLALARPRARAGAAIWRARVSRRLADARDGPSVHGPGDLFERFGPEMASLVQEQLRAVLLDGRNHLLGVHLVYQGRRSTVDVDLCDCFREAVRAGAAGLILLHNHPSLDGLTPSGDDWRLTRDAGRAGELLAIPLLDHIIVGRDAQGVPGFVSLARLSGAGRSPAVDGHPSGGTPRHAPTSPDAGPVPGWAIHPRPEQHGRGHQRRPPARRWHGAGGRRPAKGRHGRKGASA